MAVQVSQRSGRPDGWTGLRLGQAAFATVYADAVLAVLSIVLVPYLIRRLGAEPYGVLGIVSVLAGQLGVLHFGVGTAATRLVAESRARGGEGVAVRIKGIAVVGAAASLLVGVVFPLLAPVAWRSVFNVSAETLPVALGSVPAAAVLVALTPASAAVHGLLTGQERFLFAAALRLYQGTGRLLVAVGVVALGGGVTSVLWAQAMVDLSAVAAGSARAALGISRVPGRDGPGPGLRQGIAMVLAIGAPFALASLLSGLLTDAEKLVVGVVRTLADFTYYIVPFNAVIKFTVIAGAVVRVLMPRLAALGARGDRAEARILTERSDRILVTAMVGMIAPLVALTPELLGVWLGEAFVVNSTTATRLLLVGVALNTAAFPAHASVLARGRPSHLTALYAVEVVLYLGLAYGLVTWLGLTGAAAAWTLRVLLDTLAQRALAERALGERLRDGLDVWGSILVLGALAAAAPGLGLGWRAALGASLTAAAAVRLGFGRDARLLLDSLLPWRWREGARPLDGWRVGRAERWRDRGGLG